MSSSLKDPPGGTPVAEGRWAAAAGGAAAGVGILCKVLQVDRNDGVNKLTDAAALVGFALTGVVAAGLRGVAAGHCFIMALLKSFQLSCTSSV